MKNRFSLAVTLSAAMILSGCVAGMTTYVESPDIMIATPEDRAIGTGRLGQGRAAIAYDPDGCQNWIIDDGMEGYSSPRCDPVSGRPVCDDAFPPGTVIGDYQPENALMRDIVPGSSR